MGLLYGPPFGVSTRDFVCEGFDTNQFSSCRVPFQSYFNLYDGILTERRSPSWPDGGEVRFATTRFPIPLIPSPVPYQVDIIEYVNTDQANQYTLHTGSKATCRMGSGARFDGTPLGTECRSGNGSNNGCGIRDFDGTAGAPFNAGAGGVVAMLWDETQLSFWRFARAEIPQDIHDGNPDPDCWGTPIALWTDESCDIENSFHDMERTSHQSRYHEHDGENAPPFDQWLLTSQFVATGLDLLTTTADSQELARRPLQIRLTTTVRFFFPPCDRGLL
jgi:hypothetical protein